MPSKVLQVENQIETINMASNNEFKLTSRKYLLSELKLVKKPKLQNCNITILEDYLVFLKLISYLTRLRSNTIILDKK